jgi:hypothetical protein
MNHDELLKFCEEDPAAADATIAALRSAINFRTWSTRLRAMFSPPKPRRVELRLIHSKDPI